MSDPVRLESAECVRTMQEVYGLEVWLCTGDSQVTADAVAATVGVAQARVVAQALPSDKVELVQTLQKKFPGRVCMVGDGVNDGPSLAAADLGVAIGAGTNITQQAADIVVVKSSLLDFVTVLKLARATVWVIRRNFIWAFLFNICGVPIAGGALYKWGVIVPPSIAGAMMAASSLLVVASSLHLWWFKPFELWSSGNTS